MMSGLLVAIREVDEREEIVVYNSTVTSITDISPFSAGKVGDETAGRKEVEEKCPRRESTKDETLGREMAED
jgi:hypothetical protein